MTVYNFLTSDQAAVCNLPTPDSLTMKALALYTHISPLILPLCECQIMYQRLHLSGAFDLKVRSENPLIECVLTLNHLEIYCLMLAQRKGDMDWQAPAGDQ